MSGSFFDSRKKHILLGQRKDRLKIVVIFLIMYQRIVLCTMSIYMMKYARLILRSRWL